MSSCVYRYAPFCMAFYKWALAIQDALCFASLVLQISRVLPPGFLRMYN